MPPLIDQPIGTGNAVVKRHVDLARAKTVAVTKHGRPVVVVLSVEGYERLKPLDTPETPPASEEQG